jgi:zinc protease
MTVVRNEFEGSENQPASVLFKRLLSVAYDWHNYGNVPIGARSDIEGVPIERLQAFYRTYYQPDNAVLLVAGKIDEAATLALVQQYFGGIPRPGRVLPEMHTVEPTQDGERRVVLRREGDVPMAAAVYHVPPGSHEDFPALQILGQVLADAPAGRLHKELVEKGKAAAVFPAGLMLGPDRERTVAHTRERDATIGKLCDLADEAERAGKSEVERRRSDRVDRRRRRIEADPSARDQERENRERAHPARS